MREPNIPAETTHPANPERHAVSRIGFAAWRVHAGMAVLLALLAILPAGTMRACALGILAGVSPALCLRKRWSACEWIGVSAAVAPVFWVAAAALSFRAPALPLVAWFPSVTALVLCLSAGIRGSRVRFTSGDQDRAAIVFTLLLAVPVTMVALSNGPFVSQGGSPGYEARSWFSSDSFYLFALAQSALERQAYPPENPFFPGTPNRYPSWIHCGLAAVASLGSGVCAVDCWRFFPFFALAGAPLWVFAGVRRSGRNRLPGTARVAAACAFCALVARPDFLIAIHSQAMALPVLLLLLWVLGPPRGPFSARRHIPASFLALVLVLSHSVTAAVALAVLGTEVLRLSWPGKPRGGRIAATATWCILVVTFVALNRGGVGMTETDRWSERLATNLFRYHGPWLVPLAVIAVALGGPWSPRGKWHATAVATIALLGLLYTMHGSRLADPVESWFVLFNSRRFWFFCLIVAVPGILVLPRRIAWVTLILLTGSLALFPDAGRRDCVGLVFAEPRIAGAPVQRILEAVRNRTPAGAHIHTNLGSWVAAFTGRSALVTDPINLWANGTVLSRDFDARIASHNALFNSPVPEEQISSLIKERSRFVVAYGQVPDKFPFCALDSEASTAPCVSILIRTDAIWLGEVHWSK